MRRFLLVGLTGGIGSGKSTVSRLFRDLGCLIIDADTIAREVVEPGEPAWRGIVEAFGREILLPDGQLDRKGLGALVFADPAKRRTLNALTHPAINAREQAIQAELEAQGYEGIVILDAALLIEAGGADRMDRLVVVYGDEATQLRRLMDRDDLDEAEARRRIASQMPLREKVRLAHHVIDNSGRPEETAARVRDVHAALLAELRARQSR
ncbi:MAG: dephospho-CoA kinase [Candidatus Rokubacteria bacterium]|nr:dephospho-CoA kinase [Candidatus Rokubacteria bacterium]